MILTRTIPVKQLKEFKKVLNVDGSTYKPDKGQKRVEIIQDTELKECVESLNKKMEYVGLDTQPIQTYEFIEDFFKRIVIGWHPEIQYKGSICFVLSPYLRNGLKKLCDEISEYINRRFFYITFGTVTFEMRETSALYTKGILVGGLVSLSAFLKPLCELLLKENL